MDLGQRQLRKGDWAVYLTLESRGTGNLSVSIENEKIKKTKVYSYPSESAHALQKRIPFAGSGRRYRLYIESTGTVVWRLVGGVTITAEVDPD